jgi:hypothetical protein
VDRISSFRDHHHVRAPLIAVALAASACFAPDIPNGTVPCGPAGECPSDFACTGGVCVKGGVVPTPDAPLTPTPDAPLIVDAQTGDAGDNGPPPDSPPDSGPIARLVITFAGTGGGTITANGMPCTASCTLVFPPGTQVTVTQTASGNSVFAGYGGDCMGTGACQLSLASDKMITATFNPSTVQVTLTTGIVGPGKVSLMPPGTPCGPTCTTFPMGTMVLMTPVPDSGLSFIGWQGGGCDAQTGPCMVTLDASTTVNASFCTYNFVVDPSGNDTTNAGTCVAPFQTVTKALGVATFGQKVSVRPGTYAAAETFPLTVPEGVVLTGDELALGNAPNNAVRLQGGALTSDGGFIVGATVVVARKATVAGFLIVDTLDNPAAGGVVALAVSGVGADQATIRANTIATAMGDGVVLYHGTGVAVSKNYISKNGGDGVHIYAQAPGAVLDGNQVLANGYGVEVAASADLGGGTSPGQNTFACNTNFDVLATGAITVTAKNDFWDAMPPAPGCAGSADLCAQQGAQVTTDGAALKQAACP